MEKGATSEGQKGTTTSRAYVHGTKKGERGRRSAAEARGWGPRRGRPARRRRAGPVGGPARAEGARGVRRGWGGALRQGIAVGRCGGQTPVGAVGRAGWSQGGGWGGRVGGHCGAIAGWGGTLDGRAGLDGWARSIIGDVVGQSGKPTRCCDADGRGEGGRPAAAARGRVAAPAPVTGATNRNDGRARGRAQRARQTLVPHRAEGAG